MSSRAASRCPAWHAVSVITCKTTFRTFWSRQLGQRSTGHQVGAESRTVAAMIAFACSISRRYRSSTALPDITSGTCQASDSVSEASISTGSPATMVRNQKRSTSRARCRTRPASSTLTAVPVVARPLRRDPRVSPSHARAERSGRRGAPHSRRRSSFASWLVTPLRGTGRGSLMLRATSQATETCRRLIVNGDRERGWAAAGVRRTLRRAVARRWRDQRDRLCLNANMDRSPVT